MKLNKLTNFEGVRGPVVTIVMDGIGLNDIEAGNAIKAATTPTLEMIDMAVNITVREQTHKVKCGVIVLNIFGESYPCVACEHLAVFDRFGN